MGMLVAALLLLVEAVLFFISTTKKIINLILSIAVFIASAGCFGSFLENSALPYLRVTAPEGSLFILSLEYFSSFLLSLSHFVPYSILLIFSVYFSGYLENKARWQHALFTFFILTPTFISFILFPVGRYFCPDFKFLSIWSGIYLGASLIILQFTNKKALTGSEKNDRFFVFVAILPTKLVHYLMVIVTQALGNKTIWKYSYFIVAVFFAIYLIFIIKYGIFGLKIKFEKIKLDTAIKTINSSTVIFNHAVKNEVAKISMCTCAIKSLGENMEYKEIKDKISLSTEIIEDSVNHLLNLVDRINDNSKPIVLDESIFSLKELVETITNTFRKTMTGSNIIIDNSVDQDFRIKADYTHIRECIGNIVNNSTEAMATGGKIDIYLEHQRGFLVLTIKDNGPGISEEHLPHLFDPFYTTMKNGRNFGLGLFYCYNVMKKHNGNIEISSIKGSGTVVRLIFPEQRVLSDLRTESNTREGINEKNQIDYCRR